MKSGQTASGGGGFWWLGGEKLNLFSVTASGGHLKTQPAFRKAFCRKHRPSQQVWQLSDRGEKDNMAIFKVGGFCGRQVKHVSRIIFDTFLLEDCMYDLFPSLIFLGKVIITSVFVFVFVFVFVCMCGRQVEHLSGRRWEHLAPGAA